MPRTARQYQLFTVREAAGGGLCGHYRTLTAEAAIARFWQDQAATSATFRRSQPFQKFVVVASVEEPPVWISRFD
jgi:hypothetical protein